MLVLCLCVVRTQCVPTVATRAVGAKIYRPSVLVIAHLAESTDLIAHLLCEVDLLTPLAGGLGQGRSAQTQRQNTVGSHLSLQIDL